ncbi:MAG: hypothetical protein IPP74_14720 [Alphaproteobacteria bacterium]|nr:hypothetical protein [Alphaproteobacteria bacterium]
MLTPQEEGKRFISIKSDGLFHEKVSQETEGAKLREYKLKDGTEGSKWELLYKDLSNVHIKSIYFEDSEYGENICTTFTDGENEVTWSENTGTNFGSDWMKRLPNLDFTAKVSIKPYAFTDENSGKTKKGVSVYQNDKISDFFYDWDKREELHGFPKPQKDRSEMKTDDWKLYFLTVKMFLVDYTKKNIVGRPEITVHDPSDYPTPEEEGIRPQDIPF